VIHWPSYNQSIVRRGEILFSYDFLDMWDYNLDRMNENKKGKPYSFPDSFILIMDYILIYFHLPYRQTEGVIKVTGKNILPDHPCYSQICRRLNKLDIISNMMDDDDENIVIAIYSTGIKVTKCQWMQEKWLIKKKGYLKIHIAANIKSKEILALEVTDEKVHYAKVMLKLIELFEKKQ
jgi:hypothetical protein